MNYNEKKQFGYKVFDLIENFNFSAIFNSNFEVTKIKFFKREHSLFLHIWIKGYSEPLFRLRVYIRGKKYDSIPKIKAEGDLLNSVLWEHKTNLILERRGSWYCSEWDYLFDFSDYEKQRLKNNKNEVKV